MSRAGEPLRPGITAIVAARNEEYLIGFCLRSLIGGVDQIICIDNGSEDGTLERMREFQWSTRGEAEVEVLSIPGALLGACREAGLDRAKYQWHLRWDADMVAHTTGAYTLAALRQRILDDDRPRTIQLPRTNLWGDLRHAQILSPVVDPGEPILMRFSRHIEYREYGRFDTVRVPFHYRQVADPGRYYMHCTLKSDENLIHHFHYFTWREAVNTAPTDTERRRLEDFETFTRDRNLELFGTVEPRALKYRFQRQMVYHLHPYDADRHGPYPDVLRPELTRSDPRFEIVYRDGRPWGRIDRADPEMLAYRPTPEDLAWDPERFLRRFVDAADLARLGIAHVVSR